MSVAKAPLGKISLGGGGGGFGLLKSLIRKEPLPRDAEVGTPIDIAVSEQEEDVIQKLSLEDQKKISKRLIQRVFLNSVGGKVKNYFTTQDLDDRMPHITNHPTDFSFQKRKESLTADEDVKRVNSEVDIFNDRSRLSSIKEEEVDEQQSLGAVLAKFKAQKQKDKKTRTLNKSLSLQVRLHSFGVKPLRPSTKSIDALSVKSSDGDIEPGFCNE